MTGTSIGLGLISRFTSSARVQTIPSAAAALLAGQKRSIVNIKSMYVAEATATGKGRSGFVKGTEGFESPMIMPKALGGPGNSAGNANPEILFGAGYASCFLGALHAVAPKMNVKLPEETSVRTRAHIGTVVGTPGFGLAVELFVKVPGLDKETAQKVIETAHQVCPYSVATRGNIDVRINVE